MKLNSEYRGDRDQQLSAFARRRGASADEILSALSLSGSARTVKLAELATGIARPDNLPLHDTIEAIGWCAAVVSAVLPENLRADLPKGAAAKLKSAAARLARANVEPAPAPAPLVPPKDPTPAKPAPALPPVKPTAPVEPNAEQIRSLAKVLGGVDASRVIEAESEAAALEMLDRLCFQAHLRAPWWGENREAKLGAEYWRPDAGTITGLARAVVAMKQTALNKAWSTLNRK